MAFVAPLALLGGAALSTYGGLQQAAGTRAAGQASYNAGMYSAAVAAQNAEIANQRSDRAIAAGSQKASMESLKGAANLGAIKAGQAAAGVDVNTGSAVRVQESARMLNKLNADTTMNNAQETAYGYKVEASQDEAQAKLDVMGGEQAKSGADRAANAQTINAFGSGLLGAATAVGPKWNLADSLSSIAPKNETWTGGLGS